MAEADGRVDPGEPDSAEPEASAEQRVIDPTHVYCESCGIDVSYDCFWLPMPGSRPGEVVFMKIIPMMCSSCGDKVLTAPMAPMSQLQVAREMPRMPNRAQRRHPEIQRGR